MRARTAAPSRKGSWPRTSMEPPSGWCSPSIIPSTVVFPAPLAPRRPVTPLVTRNDAPSNASVDPHRLLTSTASTTVVTAGDVTGPDFGTGCGDFGAVGYAP